MAEVSLTADGLDHATPFLAETLSRFRYGDTSERETPVLPGCAAQNRWSRASGPPVSDDRPFSGDGRSLETCLSLCIKSRKMPIGRVGQ